MTVVSEELPLYRWCRPPGEVASRNQAGEGRDSATTSMKDPVRWKAVRCWLAPVPRTSRSRKEPGGVFVVPVLGQSGPYMLHEQGDDFLCRAGGSGQGVEQLGIDAVSVGLPGRES